MNLQGRRYRRLFHLAIAWKFRSRYWIYHLYLVLLSATKLTEKYFDVETITAPTSKATRATKGAVLKFPSVNEIPEDMTMPVTIKGKKGCPSKPDPKVDVEMADTVCTFPT